MQDQRTRAPDQSRAPIERKNAGGGDDLTKTAVDGVMKAFEEFKATNDQRLKEIEKKGSADPATEAKLAKIEQSLGEFEGISAKLTAAEAESKKAKDLAEELKGRLDQAELKANRPRAGGEGDKAEIKNRVNQWGRAVIDAHLLGIPNLSPEQTKAIADVAAEYKAMSVGNDATGGYLAPSEYVRELLRGVTEASPVRSLVRVRPTAAKSMMIPKRTGQFAARWTAENGNREETTGLAFGMEEIHAHEMYALIDISEQNLEDSAFDLESEITFEATEQFAVAEGAACVTGQGPGKPEGFMVNADVGTNISGSATTIADADGQANGLITLKHGLKTAYTRNASWALNRTTLGSVRKLKDADKGYIWQPGLALGKPNTIDGDPYVELPDMPNEGAGLKPIAYGDFLRGYTLVDRIVMTMLRDPYTQATSGNIRFLFRRRVGGQVVMAEAIRTLTCAAA